MEVSKRLVGWVFISLLSLTTYVANLNGNKFRYKKKYSIELNLSIYKRQPRLGRSYASDYKTHLSAKKNEKKRDGLSV